jgi:hypothetical protein
MNASQKTVRVFIISTFRDVQGERDHLVRRSATQLQTLYPCHL